MNWKFWKRREETVKYRVETQEVSLPSLARWYLYDTEVVSPNKIAQKLGLLPTSAEGEAAEEEASELRKFRVFPYGAFISAMADINARVMVAVNDGLAPDMSPDDREKLEEVLRELYSNISFMAIYSAFAAALEIGIIANPGVVDSNPVGGNDE